MKLGKDNIIEMTWKEDMLLFGRAERAPVWKRLLAPAQHWFACKFLGHTAHDPNNFFDSPMPPLKVPKGPPEIHHKPFDI